VNCEIRLVTDIQGVRTPSFGRSQSNSSVSCFTLLLYLTPTLRLNTLFDKDAQNVLSLVDREAVSQLVAPSGRTVHQVVGSTGAYYTCLIEELYCNCTYYKNHILQGELCKHLVSILIARSIGSVDVRRVNEEQVARLLTFSDD